MSNARTPRKGFRDPETEADEPFPGRDGVDPIITVQRLQTVAEIFPDLLAHDTAVEAAWKAAGAVLRADLQGMDPGASSEVQFAYDGILHRASVEVPAK